MNKKINKSSKKKVTKKKQCDDVFICSKKEVTKLKSQYKKGALKFDSKKIAEALLKDKDLRRGLIKRLP